MAGKKFYKNNLVYSTNPDLMRLSEENEQQEYPTPSDQKIKVKLDKRNRAGKVVTLITDIQEADEKIADLGKELRKYCGTGGSVSDREILIQGDCREKVCQYLVKKGYTNTKMI